MDVYRKRRLVLTMIFAGITTLIFIAMISYAVVIALNELQSHDSIVGLIFTLEFVLLAASHLSLLVWDVYVSLRYFLGEGRYKTGFYTFVNIFALFAATVIPFAIVNVFLNPFHISWINWFYTTPQTLMILNSCVVIRMIDVVLRIVYLPTYIRHCRTVNTISDEGAHRITDSLERPPLT